MRKLIPWLLALALGAAVVGAQNYQAGGAFNPAQDVEFTGVLRVPRADSPSQTIDGALVWDSDSDLLTIGTGSTRKTAVDTDSTQTLAGKTFTSPVVNTAMVAGGSSLTLTAATHGGKTIALDTAAGTTITLPAASGSGARFCFLVTVAATSNQHRIVVVGNDAFFGGITQGNDTDNATVTWPTAADADQINMSGTATGGVKGAVYCVADMVADGWHVWGNSDASGTEATPFATGQVS